jgi:hypothetical protein
MFLGQVMTAIVAKVVTKGSLLFKLAKSSKPEKYLRLLAILNLVVGQIY